MVRERSAGRLSAAPSVSGCARRRTHSVLGSSLSPTRMPTNASEPVREHGDGVRRGRRGCGAIFVHRNGTACGRVCRDSREPYVPCLWGSRLRGTIISRSDYGRVYVFASYTCGVGPFGERGVNPPRQGGVFQPKSSLYRNNRQPYGSLSNVLR